MDWTTIIIIAAILIAFVFCLWCCCAANKEDDRDDQIEWLRQEYARQKRKHQITFKEQRPRKHR